MGINVIPYNLSPSILNKAIISKISTVELAHKKELELPVHSDDEFKLNEKLTIQHALRYTQFLNLGPSSGVRRY